MLSSYIQSIWTICFFLISILGNGACSSSSLTLQPSEQKVVRQAGKGNSYFMRCRGEGTLAWRHRRINQVKDISTSGKERVHSEKSTFGLDLMFRHIKNEDEGEYICSREDKGGDTVSFEMLVIQPIDFGATEVYQPVLAGHTSHRLQCNVKGHPFPAVTWKAKGRNVRNRAVQMFVGDHDNRDDKYDKYEVEGTDLIIKDVTKEDEGRYLCKAVQIVEEKGVIKESSFKEIIIEFKIEQKPSWIASVSHDQFYGYVTGRGNLSCSAMAEPPANFTWLDSSNNTIENAVVEIKDHKSTLTIPVEHHHVFGSYTCIAHNIHGSISKVVKFTEGAKPGTPWIEINKIFADGITLKIYEPQAEMFLKVEGFQIEFKEDTKSWEYSHTSELKLAKSSFYLVQGLNATTLYHIRARSRNKAGLSDASNVIYIKTNSLSARALNHSSQAQRTLNTGTLIAASLVIKKFIQWL